MHTVEIQGKVRDAEKKGAAGRLRAAGRIPAVLYGKGEASIPVSLETREFEGVLRKHGGGAFVLDLKIEGREGQDLKAIIKEIQRDPRTSRILHLDLMHVSMTQVVHIRVPVHLVGTPIGVKEGGVLDHVLREIDVQAQTAQIPDDIKVDVKDLGKGQSIHVGEIAFPPGVTVLTPSDRVIASILAKAVEVVVEPVAAEGAPEEAEEKAETTEES